MSHSKSKRIIEGCTTAGMLTFLGEISTFARKSNVPHNRIKLASGILQGLFFGAATSHYCMNSKKILGLGEDYYMCFGIVAMITSPVCMKYRFINPATFAGAGILMSMANDFKNV